MAERRRESFDEAVEDYARYRPGPPRAVVADLVALAGLGPGSRVVEVGCGTGQLSVPLARRGVDLTCVELGAALAALARGALAPYPGARVVVADFESWAGPDRPADAVVACNMFHWLDPATRADRCAAALRAGGALGVVHPSHVAGGTPGLTAATNPLYVAAGLSSDPDFALPAPGDVPAAYPELDGHPGFSSVTRARRLVTRRSTTASYLGLLRTDSLVNTLEPGAREAFLAGVGRVVDALGGAVSRRFLYEVVVARRA